MLPRWLVLTPVGRRPPFFPWETFSRGLLECPRVMAAGFPQNEREKGVTVLL